MGPRKIGRAALRRAAQWEALTTYRAAFKAGTLSSSHADVVEGVYRLASDELLNRWRIERRAGRFAIAVFVLTIAAGVATTGPFGLHLEWLDMALKALALISLISAVDHYAAAHAFKVGAVLLAEPEPKRKAGDPKCGHTWRAPSTSHEHVCSARPGKHGRHQCVCGFWVMATTQNDTAVTTQS
jgi:hypothetical protein